MQLPPPFTYFQLFSIQNTQRALIIAATFSLLSPTIQAQSFPATPPDKPSANHTQSPPHSSTHSSTLPLGSAPEQWLAPNRPTAESLVHQGIVIQHIQVGEYSYIEVQDKDSRIWIAAPQTSLDKGNRVKFDDGARQKDFYSRSLNRTFPEIMFVNHLIKQ